MKTLTLKVLETDKQITIKDTYTRGIDREYNRILFKDSSTTTDEKGKMNFVINPSNMQEANDYLVGAMTMLNQGEIDSLSTKDYDLILKEINTVKTPSGSK